MPLRRLRLSALVDSLFLASRFKTLAVALLLTALIAFVDWRMALDVSWGVMYVLPMTVAAVVLRPWQILGMAILCSILRWTFDSPENNLEAVLRTIFALPAYLGSGMFVSELIRNRRLVIEHLVQLEKQQALRREAEEQLRFLVASSPAAIMTMDDRGVILAANGAARVLFAIHPGESLLGQPIGNYLSVLAEAIRFDGGGPFHTATHCQARRHNGEIFMAQTWFSTYRSTAGNRLAAIAVDCSEEMRDREEQNLQLVLKSNRITAAAVSHEIRNLCGAISLVCSNLERAYGKSSQEDVQALGNLVTGLNRVASWDLQSKIQESLAPVDLREVLNNLKIVIEPAWEEIDGAVEWSLPDELPAVLAEQSGLLQAFLNLSRNSHRAVQSGSPRELYVEATAEARKVLVRFRDSGPGVEKPEKLFQPFQNGADGAGLGLFVSRAILRTYGGDLRFEPRAGACCFVVELQHE